jgi:hypothetical protein
MILICLNYLIPHLLMLDIQHVIDLEQHVEFPDPLPLTYDEEEI